MLTVASEVFLYLWAWMTTLGLFFCTVLGYCSVVIRGESKPGSGQEK